MDPFKYNASQQQQQQPMFTTVYRSSSSPAVANKSLEDVSFSSYLKSKSPPENENDTEISIFDAQKYFSADPKYTKKQQQQQQQEPPSPEIPRVSLSSSADGYSRNFRTRSFHATPTASSEASWNSQTGLLANPPSASVVFPSSDSKKPSPVSKKWFFGRKCCCTGKKSVRVKELAPDHYGGSPAITPTTDNSNNNGNGNANSSNHLLYAKRGRKAAPSSTTLSQRSDDVMQIPPIINPLRLSPEDDFPAPRQHRISASGRPFGDGVGGFSFPILNTSSTNKLQPAVIITKTAVVEEPPRDSLEVFQPSRPPQTHFNPGSPIARGVGNTDDDAGSDASSDLFEIESFSTQTTSYPMYRRRDSLDEAPTFNARRFANNNNNNNNLQYGGRRSLDEKSVAATECYAPSEVSIDWSVTTAEGFDRASVSNFSISASEMGSAAFLRQRLQHQQEEAAMGGDNGKRNNNNNNNNNNNKGNGGGGGGGLLMMSCRQEKAVSVGPQPVKFVPPVAALEGGPQFFPVHVGGRPPRANKPPLGSDHSARLSLAFAA